MTISAGEGLYIHTYNYGFLKWLACISAVGIGKKSPPQIDYTYTKNRAVCFFGTQTLLQAKCLLHHIIIVVIILYNA